jgi:hypothetical protein
MFLPAQYKVLSKQFVGRVIDEQFLAYLRAFVDPCGETGDTPHRREGGQGFIFVAHPLGGGQPA